MSRLAWGAVGQRVFEAGTDRGVLYPTDAPGVPWNGLTAVNEAPSGAEERPFYIDGIRYIDASTAEEFVATLEAFYSPEEFDQYDGSLEIENGLFVTQQRRKSFGLCYRTHVGNDTDGIDNGYKLHLVYNATAAPVSRSHTSIGDQLDLQPLSWQLRTKPVILADHAPSAHFVVDSTKAPLGLIRFLEGILYGTEEEDPRLPPPTELSTLFKSPGPIVKRNLATRPLPLTGTLGNWLGSPGETATAVEDEGPAVQLTDPVGGGGGYLQAFVNAVPGKTRWAAVGMDVKALHLITANSYRTIIRTQKFDGTTATVFDTATVARSIPHGEWVRVVASVQQNEFTADQVRYFPWPSNSSPIGAQLRARRVVVAFGDTKAEAEAHVADYFDGDNTKAGGETFLWEGAAHNSPSVVRTWNEPEVIGVPPEVVLTLVATLIGNGSFTLEGTAVDAAVNGIFLASHSSIVDNNDGTYTVTS